MQSRKEGEANSLDAMPEACLQRETTGGEPLHLTGSLSSPRHVGNVLHDVQSEVSDHNSDTASLLQSDGESVTSLSSADQAQTPLRCDASPSHRFAVADHHHQDRQQLPVESAVHWEPAATGGSIHAMPALQSPRSVPSSSSLYSSVSDCIHIKHTNTARAYHTSPDSSLDASTSPLSRSLSEESVEQAVVRQCPLISAPPPRTLPNRPSALHEPVQATCSSETFIPSHENSCTQPQLSEDLRSTGHIPRDHSQSGHSSAGGQGTRGYGPKDHASQMQWSLLRAREVPRPSQLLPNFFLPPASLAESMCSLQPLASLPSSSHTSSSSLQHTVDVSHRVQRRREILTNLPQTVSHIEAQRLARIFTSGAN